MIDALILGQLEDKKRKHAEYLHFLQASRGFSLLDRAAGRLLLDHGEQVQDPTPVTYHSSLLSPSWTAPPGICSWATVSRQLAAFIILSPRSIATPKRPSQPPSVHTWSLLPLAPWFSSPYVPAIAAGQAARGTARTRAYSDKVLCETSGWCGHLTIDARRRDATRRGLGSNALTLPLVWRCGNPAERPPTHAAARLAARSRRSR